MQRINTATKAVDLFGANKHGWKAGNPATNTPATQQSADWFNAVQEELCNVIEGAGLAINPASRTQLSEAIVAMITSGGTTGGLKRSFSLTSGAILREYGNVSTGTLGHIAIGYVYNSSVNLATGVWSGRDVAGICWAEVWDDTTGVKDYWFAAADNAGVAPTWVLAYSMSNNLSLGSAGAELVTSSWVRQQVGNAGKNADGLRTNISLPAGTDPNSVVLENGDYNFDASTSPNMPTSGLVWVQMSVTRHHNTSWSGMPAGKYIFATIVLRDFYTNRTWERRAVTDFSGVTTFTPWSSPQAISFSPVSVTRVFNAVYTNTRTDQIFVNYNFGLLSGQTVTVLVDGITVDTVNPNTPAGSFGGFITIRPSGTYEFVTSTGAIMQSCVEYVRS